MKPFWKVETFVLESGLTVEWIQIKGFHTHSCYVTIPIGSLFDAEIDHCRTPTGIAHFLEHRLFDTPKGDALGRFSAIGCDANAFTTYTFTTYYFDTSMAFMEGIEILLEMTTHFTFDEEEVEKEKKIILEERKMVLDRPIHRLQYGLFQNLFSRPSYQEEIVGSEEDIQKTTWDDLKRVFHYAYDPQKMRLFLFGELSKEQKHAIKNMILPKVENRPLVYETIKKPVSMKKQEEKISDMDVPIPYLAMGKKCMGLEEELAISAAQMEALRDVVSHMLFADSSRLMREMHEENLLVTSLYGEIVSIGDVLVLQVLTNSFHEEKMMRKLRFFFEHIEEYVDRKNWKRVIQNCVGSRILSLQSLPQFGYEYVSCRMQNLDLADVLSAYGTLEEDMMMRFLSAWKKEEIVTHIVKHLEKKKKRK